jgi:hypothetical protein
MASSNSSAQQSFIIALVVFVILTFVLAVTTYLFFKKADENLKAFEAKQKELSEANTKRLDAEAKRDVLVKDVLGFDEGTTNEEIMESKKDAIDAVYGSYLKNEDLQPTYADAVDWLSAAIKKHSTQLSSLQNTTDDLAKKKKEAEEQHQAEMKKLDEARQVAQADLDKLRKEKADYETQAAADKNKLIDEKKAADDRVKRARTLSGKIAEAQKHLSQDRRGRWPADPADGGKEAGETDLDERRLALLLEEMRDRERAVARLNQLVAQLRAVDPAIQSTVLNAIPTDDRVDSFDGRILSVNEIDRTVLVACGTTTGLRPGLQFSVFSPGDPQPQLGDAKATVEVVAIESDSLVRCRVRRDETRDPILPGDVVATSLWSPGAPLEVVVVGVVQFGGDTAGDERRLKQLIERIGGSVEEAVAPSTTMVVDAGVPKMTGGDAELQGARKQMTAKQKEFRTRQLEDAKKLGIKVVGIEPFLGMMGLQTEAVRENRLPVPVRDRALPTPAAPTLAP